MNLITSIVLYKNTKNTKYKTKQNKTKNTKYKTQNIKQKQKTEQTTFFFGLYNSKWYFFKGDTIYMSSIPPFNLKFLANRIDISGGIHAGQGSIRTDFEVGNDLTVKKDLTTE